MSRPERGVEAGGGDAAFVFFPGLLLRAASLSEHCLRAVARTSSNSFIIRAFLSSSAVSLVVTLRRGEPVAVELLLLDLEKDLLLLLWLLGVGDLE